MTRYEKLFGTPERAAETVMDMCQWQHDCQACPLYPYFARWCDGDMDLDELMDEES